LKAEDALREERIRNRRAELQRMAEEKRLRLELEEERKHIELERIRERKTKDDLIQNYLEQIADLKRRFGIDSRSHMYE